MTLSKTYFFIFLFALMLNTVDAASVYKWVDEDGQVHYGSRPKHEDAEQVEIKNRYIDSGNQPAPLSAQERADKQQKFINALDAENESISEEKRKQREQEEQNIARCNAARDQLKRREAASALYDLDEKGNRVLLDKKQYEIAMEQARARVHKWCD
ncbi:MAG: DUF4124 domain-containing protein [Gammaproteobacteria bacterium]|nr:DUF4124 domain-containing protein [Gammaproteobacteria bacterium]